MAFLKHLEAKRLVSCEPKKSCYLCGNAHRMRDCGEANGPRRLGPVLYTKRDHL